MHLPFLRPAVAIAAPPDNIGGVPVRISTRAKRMALRADARSGRIVLVLPKRKSWTAKMQAAALSFVTAHRDWIAQHDKPTATAGLQPDMQITLLDHVYTLRHRAGRGVSRIDGDEIIVTGGIDHFDRRARDCLKRYAAEVLTARVYDKARMIDVRVRDVRLRDPASRWGSCGPDGEIMLSWRLVLLPAFVMDYIVAHEVAHRVHMDHSRNFWRLCLSMTDRGAEAKRWLKLHGSDVMRF